MDTALKFVSDQTTLDDIIAQHRESILEGGKIAGRLRVVANDGLQLTTDDRRDLAAVVQTEHELRSSLIEYRVQNELEAFTRAMYISALMISQTCCLERGEIESISQNGIGKVA